MGLRCAPGRELLLDAEDRPLDLKGQLVGLPIQGFAAIMEPIEKLWTAIEKTGIYNPVALSAMKATIGKKEPVEPAYKPPTEEIWTFIH